MYLESLDSFVQQAEALFASNPLKTRYVMKYRHCDGKLVLKVTDDDTVSAPAPPMHRPAANTAPAAASDADALPAAAVPAIQDRPAGRPEEGGEAEQFVLLASSHRQAACRGRRDAGGGAASPPDESRPAKRLSAVRSAV